MKNVFKSKNVGLGIGLFAVFLIFTAGTYLVLSMLGSGSGLSSMLADARSRIESEPKTETCPLNGGMFTKTERDIWEQRRPMGVMVENHLDARPLSGISRADIVYEAVAEGGITRFLAVYYCGAAAKDVAIGPIRSARVYFIDWISEYGKEPLYVHFGGANNICTNEEDPECNSDGTKRDGKVDPRVLSIEKLIKMGWRKAKGNALDGGANAGAPAIVRNQYRVSDEPVDWEHSAIGSTDLLFDLGVDRDFDGKGWDKNFTAWKFQDDSPASSPDAANISFEFWSNKSDYDVEWVYSSEDNNYSRLNGGEPHVDWEFEQKQITTKNVVIMFIDEEGPVDEEFHMYYETSGKGDAIIFQNGTIIKGLWEKSSQFERTIFTDEGGKEIKFVRGTIWIEAVPNGNDILYN